MLEVINAGSPKMSHSAVDNEIVLNCWEKSCPLIKELERTVNFAERRCGDLIQQLNFYKEYYEKWAQNDRVNNLYPKKKMKKCCRQPLDTGSSSENEFEKVNQYFYKKIKSKIIEMNNEITQANRKLNHKNENVVTPSRADLKGNLESVDDHEKENEQPRIFDNKISKSEPIVTFPISESEPFTINQTDKEEMKVTEKRSCKSVQARSLHVKRRDFGFIKRRYSNLQRYKIRSKSLPVGVRRKFGFGGFIEVIDPKITQNETGNSLSKTSLKTDSSKSWKSRKFEGKSKTKLTEPNKGLPHRMRKNASKSTMSLYYRIPKYKMDLRPSSQNDENYFSKNIKSESAVTRNKAGIPQRRNAISQGNFYEKSKEANLCKAIIPSTGAGADKTPVFDTNFDLNPLGNLSRLIAKPNNLVPFMRHPIPFIPCSSTSKTFNLGLNVQQVLSLIKRKRHSVTLQTVVKNSMETAVSITSKTEPSVNTLFISQMRTNRSHINSEICPAREGSEDNFSIVTDNVGCHSKCSFFRQIQTPTSQASDRKKGENFTGMNEESKLKEDVESNKLERPEDVWVVEQPDTLSGDLKKVRTRCTCFPSKHCVDYHKLLRQYTGWRLTAPTSESITSDGFSTYHPLIACTKSKLYPIPSQENIDFSIQENNGRIELLKVHNDLINLNRKYSTLQEQIAQNNLDAYEANAELDAMESELAVREVQFKDILNFYNQLMLLKENLRSLRMRNGHSMSQPAIQQCQNQRTKKDPFRPTPSMALTKVLRKIQSLQDKIKLIDAP